MYTLRFEPVVSCIRWGSDYVTGNDFFSSSVCHIRLYYMASEPYFSKATFFSLYNYCWWNVIKIPSQKLRKHVFSNFESNQCIIIVSFLGVYNEVNSMIWVFWMFSLWLSSVSDHWSVSRAAYYFLFAFYHKTRNGLKERPREWATCSLFLLLIGFGGDHTSSNVVLCYGLQKHTFAFTCNCFKERLCCLYCALHPPLSIVHT